MGSLLNEELDYFSSQEEFTHFCRSVFSLAKYLYDERAEKYAKANSIQEYFVKKGYLVHFEMIKKNVGKPLIYSIQVDLDTLEEERKLINNL